MNPFNTMAASDSENAVFTFTWSIENFSMCPLMNGEFLCTPEFVVDVLDKAKWHLMLYPKGLGDPDPGNVVCFLFRWSKVGDPEKISISHVTTVENIDAKSSIIYRCINKVVHTTFNYIPILRIPGKKIIKDKNLFLPNDTLTLRCSMWQGSESEQSTAEAKEVLDIPFPYKESTLLTEISSVISRDRMDPEYYSSQSSFCTRFPVEHRQITWTIKNFNERMKSKERVSICVISKFREKSELLLTCYVSGDPNTNGQVRIDIQRKDRDLKQMKVRCIISILDETGIAHESKEGEHLFVEEYDVWSFHPIIDLRTFEELYQSDELCLRCDFFVSYKGEELGIAGSSSYVMNYLPNDDLRSKITDLLSQNRLTDVTLTTKDCSFPVHKTVICAQSPVFQAMFNRDTEENRSGVVRIPDVDAETLQSMLQFMYKETLEDPTSDYVIKLFSVADKYKIRNLKKFCASFLKCNLSSSNVCDILALAEEYQDSDLMKSVHRFLNIHGKDVFESNEWEKWMKDNPRIAERTIEEMRLMKESVR